MTNENNHERNEAPTKRKIKKAKEKGHVLRSKEVSTVILLFVFSCLLFVFAKLIGESILDLMRKSFSFDREVIFDPYKVLESQLSLVHEPAFESLTLIFILFIISIIGSVVIGGLVFFPKQCQIDLSRVNPSKGIKKMVSLNSVMEVAKGVLKIITVGGAGYLLLNLYFDDFIQVNLSSPEESLLSGLSNLLIILLAVSASLITLAVIDLPFQYWFHSKELKMTRQELKDEQKEVERSSEVNQRMMELKHSLTKRRGCNLKQCDVLIHCQHNCVVGFAFNLSVGKIPTVTLKAKGLMAENVLSQARDYNVPVLERNTLTLEIYKSSDVGHAIRKEHYKDLAKIISILPQNLRTFRNEENINE